MRINKMRKILTTYEKNILIPWMSWIAYFDGYDPDDGIYGSGRTEEEAIKDLTSNSDLTDEEMEKKCYGCGVPYKDIMEENNSTHQDMDNCSVTTKYGNWY